MTMLHELVLPWPSKDLSPNARVFWAVKSKAVKAARFAAGMVAKQGGWSAGTLPEGRLHLWITFHPPSKRSYDDDNLLSRFKAARDGLADALGVDDKRFVSHPFVSDKTVKGGSVVVRITGGPEA